jgi:hypothetical protein
MGAGFSVAEVVAIAVGGLLVVGLLGGLEIVELLHPIVVRPMPPARILMMKIRAFFLGIIFRILTNVWVGYRAAN